jgi:histone-lysine N-methyltransferase SETDB2
LKSYSYIFLLGRLLSRNNPEKPSAIDESRKEENIMKNIFSKKRKIEVSCSDCEIEVIPLEPETHPRSAKTEECPPKCNDDSKETVM